MTRPLRVFDGAFGRLQLLEADGAAGTHTAPAPRIVVKYSGADLAFQTDAETLRLTRENLLFFNPGTGHQAQPGTQAAQLAAFEPSTEWLRNRSPGVFDAVSRPFPASSEPITPRIRQLA